MLSYEALRAHGRYVQQQFLDEAAQDRLADLARTDNSTGGLGRWFSTRIGALMSGRGPNGSKAVEKPLVTSRVRS
jgi:hypothetical protein